MTKKDGQLIDLASMVLVEITSANKSSPTAVTRSLQFETYLELVDNVFKTFGREELGDFDIESEDEVDFLDSLKSHRPQAFQLAELLFDFYSSAIFSHLDLDEHSAEEGAGELLVKLESETHERRFSLIRLLNYRTRKLSPSDPSADSKKSSYFNYLTVLYRQASTNCAKILTDQQSEPAAAGSLRERVGGLINESLEEIKYLADSLSDFLVLPEDLTTKSHLVRIQSDRLLFDHTCLLLHRLTTELVRNKETAAETGDKYRPTSQEKRPDKLTGFRLVKVKLIRFVGIMVYENELNQSLLHENKCLDALTTNLGIDEENPFLREWSIVALRHILTKLDLK